MTNQKKESEKKSTRKHVTNEYLKYSGMAFQMAGVILIFVLIGKKLDEHFQNEKPTFTLVLAVFAVIASLYLNLKDIIFNKE